MLQNFFLVLSAVGFLAHPANVFADDGYSEEEATWRYSDLSYVYLDNLFKANYCGKGVRFYLGCVAALEQMAKLDNVKNEVVVDAKGLRIEINPNYNPLDKDSSEVVKYFKKERVRYAGFEKTFSEKNVAAIEDAYLVQKAKMKVIEPFQVARVINASEAVNYDIHTQYNPAPRYNAARYTTKEAIVGLRYLFEKGSLNVVSVTRGFPAEKVGIKAGDRITEINGQPTSELDEAQVVDVMTKKIGESVQLKIERQAQSAVTNLQFVTPSLPEIIKRYLQFGGQKISYLAFENFMSEKLCDDVKPFLKEAQKSSAGLIIDLRGNGGGRTEQAACLLGALIGGGRILIYEKDIVLNQVFDTKTKGMKIFSKPVVVLVNHRSASASEVLSGNIQAYGRGVVVGKQTFGKGTEQVTSEIARLVRSQTSFVYHLANGISPQLIGITPDIDTFVNPQSMDFETNVIREKDLGISPLQVVPITVKKLNAKKIEVPADCISQRNVKNIFEAMPILNWQKDLQLLSGMAAISCLK
jgi:C-terminal peptidase prc